MIDSIDESRWKQAHKVISDLCHQRIKWAMSIPARPDVDPDLILGSIIQDARRIAAAQAEKIVELEAQLAEVKNALMVSEEYRVAYEDGKGRLYAMGGEICEAAATHLPCGEGPLGRYTRNIEREHSPQLVARMKELVEKYNALEAQLAKARQDTERLDRLEAQSDISGCRTERRTYHLTVGCSPPRSAEAEDLRAAIDAATEAKQS